MSVREITDLADVRPGDEVDMTATDEGGDAVRVIGKAWRSAFGGLEVGRYVLRYSSKGIGQYVTSWKATREVPDLPTENGTVIIDVKLTGGAAPYALLDDGEWFTPNVVDNRHWHDAAEVQSWTPAKVVADGEPVSK